ncbi:MAG: translation initiation factor IF-3 [Spirochaetes bacterium GWF1_31_7]|nr:MAG: translation initiation factor IF-3 [Spirochaetes bacterium GWE1_32_154]OHD51290.1 MAG: translation initiation factor IF-3 [Spirochaetes bacterium GWE2_31_10]OHD51487.1 MAG: translation initiation factor IF-3 [Spirochaetes bacterium GWF1_31_7]HBD93652.1 translation initiation factor IF-3 [Spirochaetia bacterium]HBI38111.1 translation initiation factor IF-3 [Spirochaetia bacterium]
MASKELRINENIRVKEVLLIIDDSEKPEVISIEKALELAAEEELDLVEISPNAVPPVCKILDFGKYKFELEKKAKDAKKKQQITKLKEIRLQPKIEKHDYDFKLNHVKEFLNEGDKVKITIRFKGRQMAHTYLGKEVLMKFKEDLEGVGIVEKDPSLEGKMMHIIVAPVAKKK